MGVYKTALTKSIQGSSKDDYLWDVFGFNNVCLSCTKSCKQHGGVEVNCPYFNSNGKAIMPQTVFKKTKRVTSKKKGKKVMNKNGNISAGTIDEHTAFIMSQPDIDNDKVKNGNYKVVYDDGRVETINKVSKYTKEHDISYGKLFYTIKSGKSYQGRVLIKL